MSNKTNERLGEERVNNQGCLMKIVEYNGANDIVIEFQDKHLAKVHSKYCHFIDGKINNPYHPSVSGVGMPGNLYPIKDKDGKPLKEYTTWCNMLKRCFDKNEKERNKAYINTICCDEWLMYDNFYEWAKSQSNYDLWRTGGNQWHLDKDIISKGSIYSPDTCCFVPNVVNTLFNKQKRHRGDLPIGVEKNGYKFSARCRNLLLKKRPPCLGTFNTPKEAFEAYKEYKENLIKKVAQIEFDAGNITEKCYNAMLKYEVEITD